MNDAHAEQQPVVAKNGIAVARRVLLNDGVIAYPTEGVFGLGCMPGSIEAVARILSIKKRDPAMGLLLIASRQEQLEPWIDQESVSGELESSLEHPITWVVDAARDLPFWIGGKHSGVAVRITRHSTAAALCDAVDSALISTSANQSGRQPARNTYVLRRQFGDLVDFVVPGDLGPARGPSEIRVYDSDQTLRPANA